MKYLAVFFAVGYNSLSDRCEITDSCQQSDANCPIRQNYPSRVYDQNSDSWQVLTGSLDGVIIGDGYDPNIKNGDEEGSKKTEQSKLH